MYCISLTKLLRVSLNFICECLVNVSCWCGSCVCLLYIIGEAPTFCMSPVGIARILFWRGSYSLLAMFMCLSLVCEAPIPYWRGFHTYVSFIGEAPVYVLRMLSFIGEASIYACLPLARLVSLLARLLFLSGEGPVYVSHWQSSSISFW